MSSWMITCPCGDSFRYTKRGDTRGRYALPVFPLHCEEVRRLVAAGRQPFLDPLEHCDRMRAAFEETTGLPAPR